MNTHKKRFTFLKSKGLNFNKVLDIGAYEGHWTIMFKQIFPTSHVLMIEANTEKEKILKPIGDYKMALLGSSDHKNLEYYKCTNGIPTGNSIYQENTKFKFKPEKRTTTTLPTLLNSNEGYDLIKMDVQGSELDIIKGALPIVKNTDFLLLELQLAEYNKGAPRIEEVISFLKNINFAFIDIFDLIYVNNCLVQIDSFFINNSKNNFKIKF